MYKLLALIFSLVVFSGSVFAFSDTENTQYENAVNFLEENGIVQGYSDGTYRPYHSINRAEFTKIIMESTSSNSIGGSYCMNDIQNQWYAKYVCGAKSQGIVSGYPDGTFKAGDEINLAEALKIILEAYNMDINYNYSIWYEPYFWFAKPKGLLSGIDESIGHNISRGEMAQLIYNVERWFEDDPISTIPTPEPNIFSNAPAVPYGISVNENSCTITSFDMAMVLVVEDSAQATNSRLDKLRTISDSFEEAFSDATKDIARMDTTSPITLVITEDLVDDFSFQELGKAFYQEHNDSYDFISFYFINDLVAGGYKQHVLVKNEIKSIGQDQFDQTAEYGSAGRLLGMNYMSKIDSYSNSEGGKISASNILLHETGHQWCCYTGSQYAGGSSGKPLEILNDNIHWYPGLFSPDEAGDALGAAHWRKKTNDNYERSDDYDTPFKYHPITMYLMGYLDDEWYDYEYPIFDAGLYPNWHMEDSSLVNTVSINDIIDEYGERSCY